MNTLEDIRGLRLLRGDLTIRCGGIKIYDQGRRELTVEALEEICRGYWDNLGKSEGLR